MVNVEAFSAPLLTAGLLAIAGCGQAPALSVTPVGSGDPGQSNDSSLAAPLISGTVSWVDGQHVWTDYAYDDRGRTATALYEDAPLSNGIVAKLESVSSVTLDVARMGIDTGEAIRIDADSDGDSRPRDRKSTRLNSSH